MPLSPPVDVYARMVSRLPTQYQNAPRMLSLLRSFATPIQEFANNQWNLYQNSQLQKGPAQIIGRARFYATDSATLYWPLPFPDASYLMLVGRPVITDGGGPVVATVDNTTKTKAGVTVNASAPFTGYVNVLAWRPGENPLARGIGGDLLDKIGKIVGEPRDARTDSEYWVLVTAKIAANKSDGKRETLIKIAKLLVPGAIIYVKDFPPCAVYVAPQLPVQIDPYAAGQFMTSAKAAGAMIVFVWTAAPLDITTTWGSIYAAGFSAGPPVTNAGGTSAQGFGSIYNSGFSAGPPITNAGGGFLAGVIQSQGEQ